MSARARPAAYPVLGQELGRQRPGGVPHHLVHVATVLHRVIALVLVHHREALEVVGQLIAADWGHNHSCEARPSVDLPATNLPRPVTMPAPPHPLRRRSFWISLGNNVF